MKNAVVAGLRSVMVFLSSVMSVTSNKTVEEYSTEAISRDPSIANYINVCTTRYRTTHTAKA